MAGMNKNYEDALQKCLEGLVKALPSVLDIVLVKLNAYFLDHQQEVIKAQENSVRKVTEFVKILRTMQDDAFFAFLTALDQLNYRHVANEIRLAANIPVPPPPHSTIPLSSGAASMIPDLPTATGENDIFSQKATMKLIPAICDYIAAHWMDIGYSLDFDDDGNQVDTIDNECNGNPKKCCSLMLKTWIQGDKGKQPKTWQTLLDILISLDRKTAHDKVKERLQYEQSQQQQNSQESIKVSQPVEATATSVSSTDSMKRYLNNVSLPRQAEGFEADLHYPVESSD